MMIQVTFFIILLYATFFTFIFNKQENDKKMLSFFSVFAFLIKPFLIFVFILPLILLLEKKINIFQK